MSIGISNFTAITRKPNIIGFALLNTGADLSWILGTSGGSGTGAPTVAILTSQINGVTAVFTIGGSPTSANLTEVVYNGTVLTPTTDYSVSAAILTLTFVPFVGDVLYVRYW